VSELFVKICGITNVEDALVAVEAGADALGLNFVSGTPRYIDVERAREIASAVAGRVKTVGVFVDASVESINRAVETVPLDLVQVHGELTPERAQSVDVPFFRAVQVRGAIDVEALRAYKARAYLLDTYVEGMHGGTGKTFQWALAGPVVQAGLPVLLSGGLAPQNVAAAVREVGPWGVDVASGVEARPGIKDHDKVRAFIRNAKGAARG
jgi:phosphoribosylanthranilate isomerase